MHQLGIVCAGVGSVEIEHEAIVLRGVLGTVGATQVQAVILASNELLRVEGDERSQARSQALGQVAGLGNVVLERGQVAGAPLSRGVEADGEQRVVDKRIVEAVLDGGGKGLAVLDIQVGGKRRDDLVVEHGVHKAANGLVVHAIAHDIKAGNPGTRDKGGVGTVEDADFTLLVRGDIGGHKDARQAGLHEGQTLLKRLIALDAPHLEGLAHGQEGILVAQTLGNRRGLGCVADAARDDGVDERGADGAVVGHPLRELVLPAPVAHVLVHDAQQLLAIVVDELAGEHDDARLAGSPAGVKDLNKLGGEARGRHVVGLAGRIVGNTGLGGVGNDDLQVVGDSHLHDGMVIRLAVRIEAAAAGADHAGLVNRVAVLLAAHQHGIQVVLGIDAVGKTIGAADGLYHDNLAVPAGCLVGHVKEAVDEGAQEIALAKLQNLLGRILGQQVALVADLLERIVADVLHLCLSLDSC